MQPRSRCWMVSSSSSQSGQATGWASPHALFIFAWTFPLYLLGQLQVSRPLFILLHHPTVYEHL
jgi:hypothetical protein